LIVPRSGARLEHPDLTVENVLVSNTGHLTLPMHCEVLAHIRAALRDDQVAEQPSMMTSRQIA
jgi:hypothetical protein